VNPVGGGALRGRGGRAGRGWDRRGRWGRRPPARGVRAAGAGVAACLAALGLLVGCAQWGARDAPGEEKPGFVPPPAEPRAARPERVVLVSVSGLVAADYLDRGDAMPTLAALAADGVAVEGLEPVAPASPSPAHATLVTGRRPADHGVVAERLLGEHGVRRAGYEHASRLQGPTLWSALGAQGRAVAALDWPTTVGAEIPLLLPRVRPGPADRGWIFALGDRSTPWLFGRVRALGGGSEQAAQPGPARDAVLAALACEVMASPAAPALLLLHLGQLGVARERHGPEADEVGRARRGVDALLGRLLGCLEETERLQGTALAVAGDAAVRSVHTHVSANAALAGAGLLQPASGLRLRSWRALARSNGGSAFVYARSEADAVQARRVLEAEAERTGFFRVVSAAEMLALGADPEAWFGLEAAPGFAFADAPRPGGPIPAARRGARGYLPPRSPEGAWADDAPAPGLVLWGRGVRVGVRAAWMRQIDVAPTLARLLDVSLDEAEGQAWTGLLALPGSG